MFGKKKQSHNGIADDLYEFLEEADKLYIKAFETRSIGILKDYFTRECCRALSVWIVNEASSRFFSEERFRNTTWEIFQQSATNIVLRKQCVYRDIHLTMSRTMKVSDDYAEEWTVQVTPDEFWVSNVKSIDMGGLYG
jgi:hypothetical protein